MLNKNVSAVLLSGICLGMLQFAHAAQDAPTPGVVYDQYGNPVRSGNGDCLITTRKSADRPVEGCDKMPEVKVAAPVPQPAPEPKPAPFIPPPPAPAPVAPPPPPPRTIVVKHIVLPKGDIYFRFGKSTLLARGQAYMNSVAKDILDSQAQFPATYVVVVRAHTDRLGRPEANQRLSEARANTVATYMLKKGLPADRLFYEGVGSAEPETGETCTGMKPFNARNKKLIDCLQPDRRVEVNVLSNRDTLPAGVKSAQKLKKATPAKKVAPSTKGKKAAKAKK